MTLLLDPAQTAEVQSRAQNGAPATLIVVAILALPPPLHGQSTINARVTEFLADAPGIDLSIVDVAPRVGAGWLPYHLSRARAYGRAMARLMMQPRKGARCIYAVYEPGLGALYTLLLVALARWLGFGIALHHHSGRLSRERPLDLDLITRIGGRSLLHIVLDEAMAQDLRHQYRPKGGVFVLSNAAFIEAPSTPPQGRTPDGVVRLGHLSNLSIEKGLARFLACGITPDGKARTGRHLILAGAPSTPEAAATIAWNKALLGESLETRGAVSGARKREFYSDIDLFVFPSLYRHEAQPLVVLEALANGRPVLALDFGYLAALVGGTGGVILSPHGDFGSQADEALQRLTAAPGGLCVASSAARAQFDALRAAALAQRDALPDALRAIPSARDGERQ